MSRIFANDVSQLMIKNTLAILMGTGDIEAGKISEILESSAYKGLMGSAQNIVRDMDRVSDILFGRG